MAMTKKEKLSEAKKKANSLKPILRIGKNGLSESQIIEIVKLLKKRKVIKIKMLKSFVQESDKKMLAKELALKVDAEIIEMIGFVVTLYKER